MEDFLRAVAEEVASEELEESLWYLVGALGDGTLYYDNGRYVVEYGQKCVDWLKFAVGLRLAKAGARPHLVRHKSSHWKIRAYNKALYTELRRRRAELLSGSLQPRYVVKLVRGLFDTDGTISRQDKRRVYIRLSQKDEKLLEAIAAMLRQLGIETTRVFKSDRYGTYALQIRSGHVEKFLQTVGTNHPLKYQRIRAFFPHWGR